MTTATTRHTDTFAIESVLSDHDCEMRSLGAQLALFHRAFSPAERART